MKRRVILGLVFLLLAAFLLPLVVNINRYRGLVAAALADGLGRPVQVGTVHLRLLPVPGLVAEDVVIGEDPAFGPEPFARTEELHASLRLRSLWTGRLSFSSLVFVEPSLNLAVHQRTWNVESLLRRGGAGRSSPSAVITEAAFFPYVEFRDGRVNFKDGGVKSIFFFSKVQAAVYRQNGRLGLRFRGAPSRTDRSLTGAGEIRADGEFSPRLAAPLSLRVRLIDAYLSDLLVLARGSESGVQGTLGLDMEVSGHVNALRVQGRLQVGRLHRWDLLPPVDQAPLDLDFSGLADLPGRRLDLAEVRTAKGSVTAFGTVRNFLRTQDDRPEWDMQVRLTDAGAGPLFAAIQHFSPRLSPDLHVEGLLNGAVRFTGPSPTGEGHVLVTDLALRVPNQNPLRAAEAKIEFAGPIVRLEPVALPIGDSHALTLGVAFDWTSPVKGARTIEVAASGNNLSIASVTSLAQALGLRVPQVATGYISLDAQLEMERGELPNLTGWARFARVHLAPGWLSQPFILQTARVDFGGRQVKVQSLVASLGDSTLTGQLQGPLFHAAGLSLDPWQADLHVNEASAAFLGTLLRREQVPQGFLAGTEAKGRIDVGHFHIRGVALEELHAGFTLSGRKLDLRDARAFFPVAGQITGKVQVDFTQVVPEYTAQAQVIGMDLGALPTRLASGMLSGKFEWSATGQSAAEINASMRLRGTFSGSDWVIRNAALSQVLKLSRVRGVDADVVVRDQQVRFTRLALRSDAPDLAATGSVGFDRSVDMDFQSFAVTGTLAVPRRVQPEIARGQTP